MLPPEKIIEATRRRVAERLSERERARRLVKEGRPLEAESAERIEMRMERLRANPSVVEKFGMVESFATDAKLLERIIKGDNLLDAWFFESGLAASRAVGRIHVGTGGYGTGSLVSPRLLLTNNHVLDSEETARRSRVEFDYQRRSDGTAMPSHLFRLRPDLFFLTDGSENGLDFTLVAVETTSSSNGGTPLTTFGHIPVTSAQGKISIGECVNIIQHPNGEEKKLALQDNELLDRLELFLHYETDTMPGSSGALLFSNQWEVVGLHHSGVPETDAQGRILNIDGGIWRQSEGEERIKWIANEGIRISKIIEYAEAHRYRFDAAAQVLLDEFLAPSRLGSHRTVTAATAGDLPEAEPGREEKPVRFVPPGDGGDRPAPSAANDGEGGGKAGGGTVRLTVPLHIEIRVGDPALADGVRHAVFPHATEALKSPYIELPYDNRKGYQADHLGIAVPLPRVTDESIVSRMANGSWQIPYEHFTVVLHRERRMALFTASNLSGDRSLKFPEPRRSYSRDSLTGLSTNDQERWVLDPRIPADHQLPDSFYNRDRKAFDKGHIVRREDVCWGTSYDQIRRANGDTFHTTNLSPQVADYNRSNLGDLNWGDLENEITAQLRHGPVSVFAGPLFAENDQAFEGRDDRGRVNVKIPQRFWKVVISVENRRLRAYAFLLRQDLSAVQFREFTPSVDWRQFLVPLRDLQQQVRGFEFPLAVINADQYEALRGR